jgi:hypothetical protein
VEEVIELRLTPEQQAALKRSADDVRAGVDACREAGLL